MRVRGGPYLKCHLGLKRANVYGGEKGHFWQVRDPTLGFSEIYGTQVDVAGRAGCALLGGHEALEFLEPVLRGSSRCSQLDPPSRSGRRLQPILSSKFTVGWFSAP